YARQQWRVRYQFWFLAAPVRRQSQHNRQILESEQRRDRSGRSYACGLQLSSPRNRDMDSPRAESNQARALLLERYSAAWARDIAIRGRDGNYRRALELCS